MVSVNSNTVKTNDVTIQTSITTSNKGGTTNIEILKFNDATNLQTKGVINIDSADKAVDFACDILNIDKSDPAYEQLKSDVSNKYNSMINTAKLRREQLDQNVLQVRLNNYVKGWAFNQFEQNVVIGKNPSAWKYSIPDDATDEEAMELLKGYYDKFSDSYIEFYDGNGDGSIDILEMFNQKLVEHYKLCGLSDNEARLKALDVASRYSKMSFREIEQSSDDSNEMQLYKTLMSKFGVLEDAPTDKMTIQDIRTLDDKEVQAYLFTKSQFNGDGANTITPQESGAIEYDIMTGGTKTPNWLQAARGFLGL